MRTTLDIAKPALAMVRSVARNRKISMGKAATELILQSAAPRKRMKTKNGVPLVRAGRTITMAEVKAALEGDD
jgi:hypothetical protein